MAGSYNRKGGVGGVSFNSRPVGQGYWGTGPCDSSCKKGLLSYLILSFEAVVAEGGAEEDNNVAALEVKADCEFKKREKKVGNKDGAPPVPAGRLPRA